MKSFIQKLEQREAEAGSVLCVGLDSALEKIPSLLQGEASPQFAFNRAIIDATHDLAACYKINMAFYTVLGSRGFDVLTQSIAYAHERGVPVILDAKYGDIGHTADYYARTAFLTLEADAVTLNPYMGEEAIAPFREYADKTAFVLCFTSNVSRIDVQTQAVLMDETGPAPLYLAVAEKIRTWNQRENLGAVVGATAPEELAEIRKLLGVEVPILCPGVGAQGGDLEEALWAGYSKPGRLIINVSRAIIHASLQDDFAAAARQQAEMFVHQMMTFFSQLEADRDGSLT